MTTTRGVIKTVLLNLNIRHYNDGVSNFGVVVRASEEVTVYGLNTDYQSADAFTAYPVDVLGTDHYAAVWSSAGGLVICATEDSTSVSEHILECLTID